MEAVVHLDTHVIAWLFAGETRLLSRRAQESIEQNELRISPIVALELDFLKEVGRLATGSAAVVEDLHARIGLEVCDLPFQRVIASAREISWARDPFDRVIIGQARAAGCSLVTKDRIIRRRFAQALW